MKLLLTSEGLANESIRSAFFELVGRKADELKVAFIPTAATFMDEDKDWLVKQMQELRELSFSYLDVVDIAALSEEEWKPRLEKADVLVFGGGNPFHLIKWMRKTGLDKMLPELLKTRVYVGNSSGSIVTGRLIPIKCKDLYFSVTDEKNDVEGLGFLEFVFLSHYLDNYFDKVSPEYLTGLAKEIGITIYALDDDSAILIDGDKFEVISEGEWEKFE